MFKEVIQDMRNSEEYLTALKELAEKRFLSEIPNSYHLIIELLSADPSSKDLLEKIKGHMENESTRGKVSLEKTMKEMDILTVHMYDKDQQQSEFTVSAKEKELQTDYKVEKGIFNEMEKIATDYELKRAEIETDIKDKNTY